MVVHYRGFSLTADQVNRLVTHALDQLLRDLPMGPGPAYARRQGARRAGRPKLSTAERQALSRRMKARWKKRREAGKLGRLNT